MIVVQRWVKAVNFMDTGLMDFLFCTTKEVNQERIIKVDVNEKKVNCKIFKIIFYKINITLNHISIIKCINKVVTFFVFIYTQINIIKLGSSSKGHKPHINLTERRRWWSVTIHPHFYMTFHLIIIFVFAQAINSPSYIIITGHISVRSCSWINELCACWNC